MLNSVSSPRTRLSPDDRRRQLVGIGLQLLTEQPLDTITVDEVARRAGISRGLLFHYFASKREYHAAVAAAGVRRLMRAVTPEPSLPVDRQLPDALDRYVAFVERRHGRVAEMVRGSATGDPRLAALMDEAHATIADRLLETLDAPVGDGFVRQAARAWLGFAERLILDWIATPTSSRDHLLAYLVDGFEHAVRRAAVAGPSGRPA